MQVRPGCAFVLEWNLPFRNPGSATVDVHVRVSSHLKEELTWAIDKRLRVISTIMLFKKQ